MCRSPRHINITFEISECRLDLYYRAPKEGDLFGPSELNDVLVYKE